MPSPYQSQSSRSKTRLMAGSIACFLLALNCIDRAIQPRLAEAGEFQYDPSSCKADAHGKLYIALGRNVLGVPATGVAMVAELYPSYGDKLLPAPDPKEPVGCPGNPEQLLNYAFAVESPGNTLSSAAGNKDFIRPARVILHRTVSELVLPSTNDPEWYYAKAKAIFVKGECKIAAVHKKLPNGLIGCFIRPINEALPTEEWAAEYIAPPEVYSTPEGRSFVVECDPGMPSFAIAHCDVAYQVRPGLGVEYQFRPVDPGTMSVDQVIDFDRALRVQIEESIVSSYPWPEPSR